MIDLNKDSKILRRTRGSCPVCVEPVEAEVVQQGQRVYLVKRCPDHGESSALLSLDADYYVPLMQYYHDVMPASLPQRDYILRLTGRCNMGCPICLASADQYPEEDLPRDRIRQLTGQGRRVKLDLMGAEPTVRDDLIDIIKEASDGGHISALHTNGIQIADSGYLQRLVDAGLDEVHLQFDGFDDSHDRVLRGQPMAAVRRRALQNLERLGVATDLVVTVMRELNEEQMLPVLDYAAEHPFVKEVFYLGCRRLGRATERFATESMAPDEVMQQFCQRSRGRIDRDQLRVFNKLYFALLSLFSLRKCLYIHHYLVLRGKDGWRPVSDAIDLPYLEPHLDRYRRLFARSKTVAAAGLLPHIGLAIARKRGWSLLTGGLLMAALLKFGFDLSQIKNRPILLGFITACDPWIHDEQVAQNCGKGEIATDLGQNESGADANVAREKLHRRLDSAEAKR